MNIYLTDLETSDRLCFPMLPEAISVQAGSVFQTHRIQSVGDVKYPNGEELTLFSWEGILPGEVRAREPYVFEWRDPKEIQSLWSVFRAQRKKLRLLVTESPINHDVYLERYEVNYMGGHGDYHYKISFLEARDLKIRISTNAGPPAPKHPVPERPSPPPAESHTVVKGNTLWGIAQKYYGKGSEYGRIYQANSDTIEAEARRHGRKNSDNGHWIYPGTTLTIPR